MTIEEIFRVDNNDLFLTNPEITFEAAYIDARQKENRLLSDAIVQHLPSIPHTHQHHKEWKRRVTSTKRFSEYLSSKSNLTILEIGCGNGWFSAKLLGDRNKVVGVDVGEQELTQAMRCFRSPNLRFLCCNDIALLPKKSFDIIVFNASLQYMEIDNLFWEKIKNLLKPTGEIHILDTPIYSEFEAQKAKERSANYYASINVELINFYHPVHWDQLPKPLKILYQPMNYFVKLIPWYSPFPWICLYKS